MACSYTSKRRVLTDGMSRGFAAKVGHYRAKFAVKTPLIGVCATPRVPHSDLVLLPACMLRACMFVWLHACTPACLDAGILIMVWLGSPSGMHVQGTLADSRRFRV